MYDCRAKTDTTDKKFNNKTCKDNIFLTSCCLLTRIFSLFQFWSSDLVSNVITVYWILNESHCPKHIRAMGCYFPFKSSSQLSSTIFGYT